MRSTSNEHALIIGVQIDHRAGILHRQRDVFHDLVEQFSVIRRGFDFRTSPVFRNFGKKRGDRLGNVLLVDRQIQTVQIGIYASVVIFDEVPVFEIDVDLLFIGQIQFDLTMHLSAVDADVDIEVIPVGDDRTHRLEIRQSRLFLVDDRIAVDGRIEIILVETDDAVADGHAVLERLVQHRIATGR